MAVLDPITLIGNASLIIQIVVLLLLFLGISYKRKLNFRMHGLVMATAVALHLVTIIVIMIPSFALAILPEYIVLQPLLLVSLVGLIHGVTGIAALVLGLYLVAAWGFRVDVKGCFKRKQAMRLTFMVWLVALIFGIWLYAIFYGPLLFG
jgi:uncharacterized membrane protein YozB (DUF420 family)